MPGQDATAFESPANCYIVSQAGTYSFKTVKGNSSESVGNVASAEVLWESFGTDVAPAVGDLISSVSYKDGHIVFKTTDKKGNAVITAKDADDNILWSWHIWLTGQPQEQEYYNNAGTVMDRNLGATSSTPGEVGALGLLYQWGRKDPFLGSLSISDAIIAESTITWPSAVSSDSSNGTIAYATAHPTTYITANLGNEDWYYTGSSSTDNTRWTTSVKAKSIYDPCPAGWRVPDGGENGVWAKLLGLEEINYPFDTTRKGMNFSGKFGSDQTIWYPFAGFYTRYEGRLYFVGEYGAYWSASPCPVRTWSMYSLDLNPVIAIPDWDNVMPVDESSRATAMSVRCMKEGTAKTVKVSQIKLVGMPTEFKVGRSVTISAVITPDDATDKSVTFTSSNPEVATVECIQSENNYSLALLKAVGPGKATITATANGGSGVKAEAEVTVIDYHITLKTQKSTGTELKLAIRWAETQAVSQDLLIGLEDITMTYESYYDAYIVTGKLTSQTVNVNGDVVYFDCREQEITSLDVSEATNLSRLICHTNLIETLNVSENLNLTSLDCQRNKLTSLDVSKNTKLDYVQCYINQLTSLTICKRVANGYKDISCYRNRLNEAAMTTLIEALPTTTRSKAELYLQNINQSDEFNSNLTNEQITTAKSKGYTVKIQQSGVSGWVEQ